MGVLGLGVFSSFLGLVDIRRLVSALLGLISHLGLLSCILGVIPDVLGVMSDFLGGFLDFLGDVSAFIGAALSGWLGAVPTEFNSELILARGTAFGKARALKALVNPALSDLRTKWIFSRWPPAELPAALLLRLPPAEVPDALLSR